MRTSTRALTLAALLAGATCLTAAPAAAQHARITIRSPRPFAQVVAAIEQAITDEKMALVCHANAQRGAAARGVAIKGNQVFLVFRNDFAVRLLAADPDAGFEAPIRIYAYENADGTGTVSYIPPTDVLSAYRSAEVQAVARELDGIFKKIVDRGVSGR